jgi:hypothetical protein
VGGLIGAAAGSQLLTAVSIRGAFAISAIAPFALIINAMFISEPPRTQTQTSFILVKQKLGLLLTAIKAPAVWRPALWLFMASAVVPSTGDIFFYFMTDEVHGLAFGPEFLSLISVSACIYCTFACVCVCVCVLTLLSIRDDPFYARYFIL